ncbi:acyl-CoA dehydrogenase family protein [Lentilitoribacter sp. Alg239-R112]|uniref:acyl-CoA dehydrogenase family protein n=1 Tax=Lentilitoribacter sp. Alg239-R112 TaxID=2305987 RepID=UPI0013A6D5E8|nr:acyl-CoA dehydrogenase family protein [Lentilitoribacter sp. Alg239-R112]
MNFELTEEQTAIFDMSKAFSQEQIAPFASEWEQQGTIPRSLLQQAGELGLGGIYVTEEFGGSGLKRLDAALIFEALSHGCPSVAAFMSIHNMCAWMIDAYGSQELKQEWLSKLCTFEKFASYCLTEPGSGSDAASLRTRASKAGDVFQLNGTKAFISGGNYADVYLVMCRTGEDGSKGISSIVVNKEATGLSFGANEHKMGWQSQPTAQVQFDDCEVPISNLMGTEGEGFKYAMSGLNGGRLNIAACALGGAQSALDKSLTYVGERKAFGKTLDQFQALQFKLADMEIKLQAARSFLHKAAWMLDQKHPQATKFCAMAKVFVTDVSFEVANEALQLHGGYGYLKDYGIEKIVRDLRVHQILEGTNEIMRVITARALLEERG